MLANIKRSLKVFKDYLNPLSCFILILLKIIYFKKVYSKDVIFWMFAKVWNQFIIQIRFVLSTLSHSQSVRRPCQKSLNLIFLIQRIDLSIKMRLKVRLEDIWSVIKLTKLIRSVVLQSTQANVFPVCPQVV